MRCLATNNEVDLLMYEKNLTLKSAIDGTKINKFEKLLGERETATVITYFLMRFSKNFNVGKNITDGQAPLIAIDIIEKYPYETIEDVFLCLKQARQGIIGDGKDYKLDGQTILAKLLPEYLDRKYAEVERLNKKVETPTENTAVELYYAKLRKQKKAEEERKKIESEIDEMVKLMDKQMLEDTIFDWERKPEMKPYLDYLKRKRTIIK
jgi:hypothetical protein